MTSWRAVIRPLTDLRRKCISDEKILKELRTFQGTKSLCQSEEKQQDYPETMWTRTLQNSTIVLRSLLHEVHNICFKSTLASTDILESYHDYKPFKDMPGPKGLYSIPYAGVAFHIHPFTNYTSHQMHKILDSLHEKYGKTFRMQFLGKSVITEDPAHMEIIFRNEGEYPERAAVELFDVYAKNNNMERGMSLVNGPEWHRVRSATQQHMLKTNSASIYVDAQADVANDLIHRISTMTYTPEEFRDELFKYATESIGVVAFNKRLGFMAPDGSALSSENGSYVHAIQTFFQLFYEDIGLSLYKIYPTKLYRKFEKVANNAYHYGSVHIKEAQKRFEKQIKDGTFNPEEPNLILCLKAHPNLNDSSVDAIMLDLLTAGTDSTAKNMEFLLLSLALNPVQQQKLYDEIVDVIGLKGSHIQAEHMCKMHYYRACMKESFRLNFPLPFGTIRILPKDVVIGDYIVPKGTCAVCNNRRLLLNSDYFESPQEFIPERWLRDRTSQKRDREYPAMALLPFGFGRRKCIGRRFAEQELWLGVTKILQNFKVSVSENDRNYEVIYTTFGQVKKPIKFTFTPR